MIKKIIKYEILSASMEAILEAKVVEYLENGYQLAGGVSLSDSLFYQAVYKNGIEL